MPTLCKSCVNLGYKSYPVSEVQDSTKDVIGDKEQKLLEIALQLERFTPRDLIEKGFARDRKDAWWWINVVGIRKLKAIRRIAPGLYTVIRERAVKLLQKPVKHISEGIKRRRYLKANGGSRQRTATRSCVGSVCVGGVVGYGGLFVDNGRYFDVWGGFRRQGRGVLWSFGVFSEAERVVYFEVSHVVTSVVLDGVVVVYSNVEDFERFGGAVARVEWRPPSGFVKRRGVGATLRKSLEEFVKAFRALWVVLVNSVSKRQVLELLRWQLSVLKRYGLEEIVPLLCLSS